MNSKDYRNIREAYLDVYMQEELTEEQVWEEVESWVNSLLEEEYDLSDYTWDEMYDIYNEGYKNLPRLRMAGQSLKKARRGFEGARTAINSGETKDTTGGQIAVKKGTKDVTQAQKIIDKLLPGGHNKEIAQAKEKFNRSVGEFAKKDPELAASFRKRMVNKESYDLYDIILSHLIDEGYADTQEAAESIMVNMSEEWKEIIVVEDIESRREMLKQQRIQQRTSSTEAQKRKRFKDQDRESLKKEIIKALIQRQQTSTN